jgi:uncharacterized membrane protein
MQKPNRYTQSQAHNSLMKLLYFLADTFINTFGITRPTEKARKQAAFFILALILIALAAATTAGLVVRSLIH